MGKQGFKRDTRGAASPSPLPAVPTRTPLWQVVLLPTLAAVVLVASVWSYSRPVEKPKPPAAWEPATKDDRLVDAFRKARNADPKATLNLAPDPVFDGKPVSEAIGDEMHAMYFVHRARQIVAVRAGEPGKGDAWLGTPGRYTLATRGGGTAPKVAVREGGRVGTPAELSVLHPDIVVEVRKGKIHALRAELHRE